MFTLSSLGSHPDWPSSDLMAINNASLVGAMNASISQQTWSNYYTAMNHLRACGEDLEIAVSFPLSPGVIIQYLGWLLNVRQIQSQSMKVYLFGLKLAHIAGRFSTTAFFHPSVAQVLKGLENLQNMRILFTEKPIRKAMSIPLMLILQHRIASSNFSQFKKLLVWTVSLLALMGAFRISELLSKYARTFDSKYTLLRQDVKLITIQGSMGSRDLIRIRVKSPKISKPGNGDEVEVFDLTSSFCPVKVLHNYLALASQNMLIVETFPIFRQESGSNYTKNQFNKDIKLLLKNDVNYEEGEKITSHSFRAAISSHMDQWGFREDEVKGWGRWSSGAYKLYCKLPSTARRRLADSLQRKFEERLQFIASGVSSAL